MVYLDLLYSEIGFDLEDDNIVIFIHSMNLGWLRLVIPLDMLIDITTIWAENLYGEEG